MYAARIVHKETHFWNKHHGKHLRLTFDKNKANYEPLSPLSFIKRTAMVYPDRASVIHGDKTYTWKETYERSVRLASALVKMGIKKGDTVAVMGNNTPETYEAHFVCLCQVRYSTH